MTTRARPNVVTLVTAFVPISISAPCLRTIVFVDGGVMPLSLYDFYFGPDNGTRSIYKVFIYIHTLHTDDTITPTDSIDPSNPTSAYNPIHY